MNHIIGVKSAAATPVVKWLLVDEESAGQRLDNFLMRHLKGVPKTHVYRIIRSGEVRINKGRAAADTRVQNGDEVRLPPVRVSHKVAEKAVRQARPEANLLELVHRLDRDTSGILLVAKKRSALKHLQEQFRERETGKTYLALVKGDWPDKLRVIDQPLHKFLLPDGERRVRVTTAEDPDGMRSITLVKVAQRLQGATLLEVTIKTGRTHQIRVHLASQGHPIAGDDKYGDFEWNRQLLKPGARVGLKRMFLHAWRLQFSHPVTDERVALQADLPPELKAYIDHAPHQTPPV